MHIDKDRPSTWKKFDEKNCVSCNAGCCQMPVEVKASDIIRLRLATEDELQTSLKKTVKRLIKEGFVQSYRSGTEFFTLVQKANSDCVFLDSKTRYCTVYEIRPDTCRGFPTKNSPRLSFCPYTKKTLS
jgi:uncharacterized protein